MVEPILSSVFGTAKDVFEKLKEQGIIKREGLIIDHDMCEAEYRLDLTLGDIHSRLSSLKNFLNSKFSKKIEIPSLETSGFGIVSDENFVENGWIINNDGKSTIDFPTIISKATSTHAIIFIRTKISSELREKLVYRQIGRVAYHENQKTVSNIDIILDYAELWHSQFSSFAVRNIIFIMNLNVLPETFPIIIPKDIREKLNKSDKMAHTKGNARKFLRLFQDVVIGMQNKEFLDKIEQIIEITPSNCVMEGITAKMRSFPLQHSEFSIIFPENFEIKIKGKIESHETAINVKCYLDINLYNKILEKEFSKLRILSKNLRF